MRTSESIKAIAPALVKAQKKMGAAIKDSTNPFHKSKYADFTAVIDVAKDPLNENGICMLQPTFTRDGFHFIETILMHESGEYFASDVLQLELTKKDMQSLGSAITYAKRYQAQSMLCIPSEDDDGEGNKRTDTSPDPGYPPVPPVAPGPKGKVMTGQAKAAEAAAATLEKEMLIKEIKAIPILASKDRHAKLASYNAIKYSDLTIEQLIEFKHWAQPYDPNFDQGYVK